MRRILLGAMLALVAAVGAARAGGPELKTEEQKTLYALGLLLAQNLATFALSPADLEVVKSGLADGIGNKEKKVDLQVYGPKIQELQKAPAMTQIVDIPKSRLIKVDTGFRVENMGGGNFKLARTEMSRAVRPAG